MLSQESRDFQVFFLCRSGRSTSLIVHLAPGALAGGGNAGSPCYTCLYCTAGGGIIRHWRVRFGTRFRLLCTQVQPDIGGQALEQGTCIARLGIMTFLTVL